MTACILFLSANPSDTRTLDLAEEYRAIDREKTASRLRDDFQLVAVLAATIDDLRGKLAELSPTVVHFGGHGVAAPGASRGGRDLVPAGVLAPAAGGVRGELALKGPDGRAATVPIGPLAELFLFHRNSVRCVVLNCCNSLKQAEAIAKHVDCAIGTRGPISDGAAIAFSKGFHRKLCDGGTLLESFDAGRNAVGLEALYQHEEDVFAPCWRERGTSENLRLAQLMAPQTHDPFPRPSQFVDGADWKQLRARSAEHVAGWMAASGPGLRQHDWREVQPAVTSIQDEAYGARIALTGRGGIGKTTTLKALFMQADPCRVPIFLTGEDLRGHELRRLQDALEFGRAETTAAGKRLALFVDAFEDFAERPEPLRNCLATLGRVATNEVATVVLTVRAAIWTQIAPSSGGAGIFRHVELADWPEHIVRAEVKASERRRISDDLVQLLRTPLLLDLFLRTFGTSQEIPEGLQSRHGILSAYWNRRVFDGGDPVARAALLRRFAEEEATGLALHHETGPEARALCSEGVLVVRQAAYVFRHALLRDFALMHWTLGMADPESMASRLSSIQSSLTRFGAIRAVLEAACDRAPDTAVVSASGSTVSAGELIEALASNPGALFMAADVMGEIDDPSPIDLARLLARLSVGAHASAFAERVVDVAKTSLNWRWLDKIAALPETTSWAEATPWVSTELVLKFADLLDVTWRDKTSNPRTAAFEATARAVARRVRAWSQTMRLQQTILENGAWNLAYRAMKVVATVEPTDMTFRWLEMYAMHSARTRTVVVELLRKIVAQAGAIVDETCIEALYLKTGGIRWEDGTIVRETSFDPMWEHDWIEWALLGADSKGPGLLDSLPARFLPIALGLLVGLEIEHEQQRPSHDEALTTAIASWLAELEASRPAQQRAVEASLHDAVLPRLSDEEATGNLVADAAALVRPPRHSVSGLIISRLRTLLEGRLKDEDPWIVDVYLPAARASRSVAARALLLDVLVIKDTEVRLPDIVDELLEDHRIYHIVDVHHYLTKAISARWSHLDDAPRARILHHIEHVARSPRLNGIYAVGPLLSAIPEEDRPPRLRPFLDLYPTDPLPAHPSKGWPRATAGSVDDEELFKQMARVEGLSPVCVEQWKRAFGWRFREDSEGCEALKQAVQDLRSLLDGCLPEGEALAENAWTLKTVCQLLRALDEVRNQDPAALSADLDVCDSDIRTILAWGFNALESFDANEVNADRRPVERASTDAKNNGIWGNALHLLDAALAQPSVARDLELNGRLLDWIAKVIEDPSPRLALQLVRDVRPDHWLRDADRGARLLRSLLCEQIADAGALYWSLSLVSQLPHALRDEILASWLVQHRAVPISGIVQFPEEIGIHLGVRAFRGDASAYAMIENVLIGQPADGLLSGITFYRHFIKGIVFGVKEVVVWGDVGPEFAANYARIITACWDAFQKSGAEEEGADQIKLALFAFHWLAPSSSRKTVEDSTRDLRPWWIVMAPLARRIVIEGSRVDVFDLIFTLREKAVVEKLGASLLRDLVEAIATRVGQEDVETLRAWSGRMENWPYILNYASELLESIALASHATTELRERVFEILQRWGGPPLRVERAVTASRNVRQ